MGFKEEVSLEDLSKRNNNFYVIFKNNFLKKLLQDSSKDEKPHLNEKFCKDLDVSFNKDEGCSLTLKGWYKENSSLPLDKISFIQNNSNINWAEIEENILGIKAGFRGTPAKIKFPIKLGRELGSIVGHILGDGSIDVKYKQICFSNSNKELLKEFSEYFESTFSLQPRIWMQRKTIPFKEKTRWEKRLSNIEELEKGKNCGLFYPSIGGAILNIIFDNFCIGRHKLINNIIKNTPTNFKIGLIRAFCDDEGTVDKRNIRIFQDRPDILEAIKEFLSELKITTSKVKSYIKRDKKRYYIDIYRKSNLIKFRDSIGLTSSSKMLKLEKASIIKNCKNSK